MHSSREGNSSAPLPPDSQDLNSVEGLWDQTQNQTYNQHFLDLDELE
jgi:hypothetical protein